MPCANRLAMLRAARLLSSLALFTLLPCCGSEDPSSGPVDGPRDDDALTSGSLTVRSTLAPEIELAAVVEELTAAGSEKTISSIIDTTLASGVEAATREKIQAQLTAYLAAKKDGKVPGAFPVLPFGALATAQTLFAGFQPKAPQAGEKLVLDLSTPFAATERASCRPALPSLTAVANAPGLQQGGLPDPLAHPCALERLQGLAAVLNDAALGERGKGSAVLVEGEQLRTVDAIIAYLVDSQHTILVQNNRYFADFLGLWYRGKSVAAPVWIDTGIAVPGGGAGTLTVPAPHAGYSFHIRGPRVEGVLEFFLGTDGGASFRPVSGMHRPSWAGERAQYSYSSRENLAKTKKTFEVASRLRQRWSQEGAALPLQGYGTLGVCTDSTSVIERVVEGRGPTLFPLGRNRSPNPAMNGGVAGDVFEAIAALPRDVQEFRASSPASKSTQEKSVIERIRTTQPMGDAALAARYPALAAQLEALR